MLATPASGKAIACMAGDFAEGDTASVFCYFPDDIENHDGVFIQYFPLNGPTGAKAKEVFVCKVEDVLSSRCQDHTGYVLKGYTRNTITVALPNVTMKAAGRYFCQFIPPDGSPRDMCNLTVRGRVTPVPVGIPQTTTTDQNQSSPIDSRPDASKVETGALSVGGLVGVILSVAVFITVIGMCLCKKFRKSKHCTSAQLKERQQHNETPSSPPGSTVTTRDENDSGVTDEGKYVWAGKVESSDSITELEHQSFDMEGIADPTFSTTESDNSGPNFLLRRLHGLLKTLKERRKNARGDTQLSASYAVPSCEARINKEALQDLLGKLRDSQAQVQEILNNVERDPLSS